MSKAKTRRTRKHRRDAKRVRKAHRSHRKVAGRTGSIQSKRTPSTRPHGHRRAFPAPDLPDWIKDWRL